MPLWLRNCHGIAKRSRMEFRTAMMRVFGVLQRNHDLVPCAPCAIGNELMKMVKILMTLAQMTEGHTSVPIVPLG